MDNATQVVLDFRPQLSPKPLLLNETYIFFFAVKRKKKTALHGAYRIDSVDQFSRLTELHEALAEIVQGPLHQDLLLLVVIQQVIPERLLGEGLWIPNNNDPVPKKTTVRHREGLLAPQPIPTSSYLLLMLLQG